MATSKDSRPSVYNLSCAGPKIEQVNSSKCLGSILTSDGRCKIEIKRRTGMSETASNRWLPSLEIANSQLHWKSDFSNVTCGRYYCSGASHGHCWRRPPKILKPPRCSIDVVTHLLCGSRNHKWRNKRNSPPTS